MTSTTTNAPLWPVPITTVGRSRGGTVVYVRGGKLHVTCILKCTFRLVPDANMVLSQPDDIVLAEKASSEDPGSSILVSSETVPLLPRVDVLLTGHACAPAGQPVQSQSVRLAIHRNGGWLLNKTLHVYGDRTDTTLDSFERIPLVYERTYGGAGFSHNPHGTGMIPGTTYPNIVHPLDPAAIAGFGPLSYEMRMARLVSAVQPKIIDEQVFELPAEMDENYFQVAPVDQLVDSLEGNEWIEIDGMHPEHHRVVSRLPGVRAVAKVYGIYPEKPDGVRTIALKPDMLHIHADSLECSVVFRGMISLRDGRSLQTLRIAAGVETEEISVAHLLVAPPMRGAGGFAESVPPPPPEVASPVPELAIPPLPAIAAPPSDLVLQRVENADSTIDDAPTIVEFDEASLTGQITLERQVAVRNPRLSISDEVTIDRSVESTAALRMPVPRISTPQLVLDDDTVSNERPLTRAEMERISAIAKQFGKLSDVAPASVREEKSTLTLDIDFSEFDAL